MKCSVRPRRCVLGCHCKLGLLRDITGKCVVAEQCTPQDNTTNILNTSDVTFLPNNRVKTTTKHLFDDDSSSENSAETTTNSDNSTDVNAQLKNMNTEQSLPIGRLGVFPPVYDKSDSRRFFKEVPYTYGRIDTTPKALNESQTANITKKSINLDLDTNKTSNNQQNALDISRTTDEMTLANNTLKIPILPTLSEIKILLDKTTVKIDSEISLNDKNNTTDAADVNTTEAVAKTTANNSTNKPSSPSTLIESNKNLVKDNNDEMTVKVPENLEQYKPYRDVISRAVKFYKDFGASTPSSYLDMNVINIPLSYRMGDNKHVRFPDNSNQDKTAKLLEGTNPTFTLFMEYPFPSRSSKALQYVKPPVGIANNPFL